MELVSRIIGTILVLALAAGSAVVALGGIVISALVGAATLAAGAAIGLVIWAYSSLTAKSPKK